MKKPLLVTDKNADISYKGNALHIYSRGHRFIVGIRTLREVRLHYRCNIRISVLIAIARYVPVKLIHPKGKIMARMTK